MSQRQRIVIEGHTFSEGELDWARHNLDKMQDRLNNNSILYAILIGVFVLGIIFYFFADGLNTGAFHLPEGWRTDLFYDLSYNIGTWLWASVVTVLLLEVGVEYSKRKSEQYVRLIESILRKEGATIPEEAGDDSSKLDAILHKLDRLDRLEAEVAALRIELRDSEAPAAESNLKSEPGH